MNRSHASLAAGERAFGQMRCYDISLKFSDYPFYFLYLSDDKCSFYVANLSINSKPDPTANEGLRCLLLTKEAAYL